MGDVEAEINVERGTLVALAHLLGSDYTDGVHGVGVVNAMETIAAYGEGDDGLQAFAKWVQGWRGDSGDVATADAVEAASAEAEDEGRAERRRAFEHRHRTVRRNWVLPAGFPSRAVTDAYFRPLVDSSEEPLSWSRPDLHALREFCSDKFGWTQEKADETLLPMMAELEKGYSQSRIDSHFAWEKRFARVNSSRLASAIKLQTGGAPLPNAPGSATKAKSAPEPSASAANGDGGGGGAAGRGRGSGRGRGRKSKAKQPAEAQGEGQRKRARRKPKRGAGADDEEEACDEAEIAS